MKKSELKAILKPIVKECLKEAMLEEGLITGIIAEVLKGTVGRQVSPQIRAPEPPSDPIKERLQRNAFDGEQKEKLNEHKQRLLKAVGAGSYNGIDLFEGTTPAPGESSPSQMASPLAGQSPADAGVDISKLFGSVGAHWNAHMGEVKERK
jgi:hypothetical protein